MQESLREKLRNSGIQFIRILWCGNGNVIRAKAAHINFLDDCLLDAFGKDPAKSFTAVRRAEWKELKDLSLEEEVGLSVERY